MSAWQRQAIAYHEAGHAVVASIVNVAFQHVVITPLNGHVRLSSDWKERPATVEQLVAFWMAGGLAEKRFTGHAQSTLCAHDDEVIEALLGVCCPPDDRERAKRTAAALAIANVQVNEDWIRKVAEWLLQYDVASAEDVRKLKPRKD